MGGRPSDDCQIKEGPVSWNNFLAFDLAIPDRALIAVLAGGVVCLASVACYAVMAIWEGWND
jgi:hypothetical protein